MSDTKAPSPADGSFSTFMFGLTLGIAGALLLGTEEGRKASRQILKSLGSGLEKNEDLFREAKNVAGQAFSQIENQIRSPRSESPPPPPPYISRPKSTPTYFESGGQSLRP